MAPPKSPWNKIAATASNIHKPQHVPATPAKSPAPERQLDTPMAPAQPTESYAQAQEDEVEVLKAIYMDDFEEFDVLLDSTDTVMVPLCDRKKRSPDTQVQRLKPLQKTTDRHFRIRLKAFSSDSISVTLSAKLSATYPKSLPSLSLENADKLRNKTREKLQKLIKSKPQELVGEVMIHEIASSIQDVLEDEIAVRENDGAFGNLEEERAVQEAAAVQLARQQEEDLQKKRDEERAEEERVLQQMIDEEKRRKELMLKRNTRAHTPTSSYFPAEASSAQVSFDRVISLKDDEGKDFDFTAVEGLLPFRKGPVTQELLVKPVNNPGNLTLILKRTRVSALKQSAQAQLKKAVLKFEEEMEEIKRVRQSSIASVFDFKIQPIDDSIWEINILMELAEKGSLGEKLEDDGEVAVAKVRSWTIDLLEALDFYHRNGLVHKKIHPNNVLLWKPSNGSVSVKLADGGFQDTLHSLHDQSKGAQPFTTSRSAFWVATELAQEAKPTRKTDVWDLGVVFIQMLFGLDAPQKYSSPKDLSDVLQCSEPLQEIMRKFFKPDSKKRPNAFDLIPCEFLRSDVPVLSQPVTPSRSRKSSTSMPFHRLRRESSNAMAGPFSRYASEWVEAGRLGKGGYGEVVKARNKVDGRLYAIKKIKQKSAAALTEVLSEVMLLSRLNHPCIVRYYTAWPEEESFDFLQGDDDTSTAFDDDVSDSDISPANVGDGEYGISSTGGLDFISSSGYPKIEFGSDEEEEEDDGAVIFGSDSEDDERGTASGHKSPLMLRRSHSGPYAARPMKTILYIQMEFCEKQTLRDLIRNRLHEDSDEYWRLFRQMLEGLAHVHGHGIIHRDLKPDNIFIDVAKVPKIGDFGLATSGQYQRPGKTGSITNADGDMTRSIGTALYVAPELKSDVAGNYNDKVDMYSMGIIFFEMVHPLETAMERDKVVRALRERKHTLPQEFETPEKAQQGKIIMSLISHRPSERPSCAELLRSGQVPVQIEDEAVKEALKALSDPDSPHYTKMMAALFSQKPENQAKDYAWDIGAGAGSSTIKANDVLLQNLVKDRLAMIFKGHGAVEIQRQLLFPWSDHYSNHNVVKLFDPSGTLVQMPYDLTLPYARSVGRGAPFLEKTFTIGSVYRDGYTGGAPRSNGEADFDILSYDTLDLALKESEVLKVIDEVIDEFPALASTQMCFHLNHADLLDIILDFCRINVPLRPAVKEVLSKLNIQKFSWQKIRNALRAPEIGVSSTSLDDLARFDWRDSPEKAFSKLRRLFEGTKYLDRTHAVFAHLSSVVSYTKHWGMRRKLYINPLSSFNEKFYSGGVLFQCLFDTKTREVLAAGGRYDRLIDEYRPKGSNHAHPSASSYHGVGMNLAWDRLVNSMARYLKKPEKSAAYLKKHAAEEDSPTISWMPRRCDCLIASFDTAVLRSTGVKLVAELISHGYTAELAIDAHTMDDILRHYRDDRHSWIIVLKHSVTSAMPDLKIRSMAKKEDTDLRSADLLNYLRNELRDREAREGSATQHLSHARAGISISNSTGSNASKANVQVLMSSHRSKKSNKWSIIAAAQARAAEILSTIQATSQIAAIETKDEVMNSIRDTRLSDPDSWRKTIQGLPLAERSYVQDLHDLLLKYRAQWKEEGKENGARGEGGKAFVYNFRTGGCFVYDLEL